MVLFLFEGERVIVKLVGRLEIEDAAGLKNRLSQLRDMGYRSYTIDLGKCGDDKPAELAALLGGQDRTLTSAGRLVQLRDQRRDRQAPVPGGSGPATCGQVRSPVDTNGPPPGHHRK
jgi:hypothetical protein